MYSLRPYQEQIIAQARDLMMRNTRSILIQCPTGSGKTVLTSHMLNTASKRGKVCWFIVHRRELVNQTVRTLNEFDVPHGVCAAGYPQARQHLVQVASIQTLARRYQHYRRPELLVFDECHHQAAGTWEKLYNIFKDSYKIGLTATPERLDGKGLRKFYSEMILGPKIRELIRQGFLSDYKVYAPAQIAVDNIKIRMGDFDKQQLNQAADTPTITGCAVDHYKRLATGKRAVVFCVSVLHSKHVTEQFNAAGIPAEHVDGETESCKRDQAIEKFRNGEIKILSNVDLFGEGFDLPAIEAVIQLRPTASLGLHLQQVGRALRPSPGKTHAIILDHAGNTFRHGLPDEDRQWSLDGRKKSSKASTDRVERCRICPSCFAAQAPHASACGYCGKPFEVEAREVEEVEGELEEVDPKLIQARRRQEQARASSLQDLIQIGKSRGYANPTRWAEYIFNARLAKKAKLSQNY